MPLYEYECKKCHHRFEKIQKFSDRMAKKCPKCGAAALEQMVSAPAVQFKGTGWYVTDYAKKSSAPASASSGSDSNSKSESSDSASKSESSSKKEDKQKSESKSESKESEKSEKKS